ncbi:MAG: DGQHR domain-containing protein [Burkholderiales bacterium]
MQQRDSARTTIKGATGTCGQRKVFLGFAPAALLHATSFADVLNEESGKGYQRRFNKEHSLAFRKYIQKEGATTIPLTFNLRRSSPKHWSLEEHSDGSATLSIDSTQPRIFTQVDCQHRLGFLKDLQISLAFMSYIGLSVKEEMEVFSVINSNAKGLSSSLLDYHEARLSEDLGKAKPEIYIALKLTESESSPWHRRLDLGGNRTVGTHRYASLRTMQKAVKRFMRESGTAGDHTADELFSVVLNFWTAVTQTLPDEWSNPRKHFLTKGIGVYSLMSLAGDLYKEAERQRIACDTAYFVGALSDFISDIDWSTRGPLSGFGGASGADKALEHLRTARNKRRLKVVRHGE